MTLNDIRMKRETELINSDEYKQLESYAEKELLHNKLIHSKFMADTTYFKK